MVWAILVINIKGGTGKSTVSEEITYELDSRGYDVGVMDADIDSANLASRFGMEEKVEYEGDHVIKPVEKDGIKLYSMENAFEDSSFSQSGKFQGDVISDMIYSAEFGDPDFLVVDCPPGSSDVFEKLVRSLRNNILGAVSVGIPDAVDDTARLVKVCNHSWVPIIGFVENMSGVYCHGDMVTCDNTPGDEDGSEGGEEHHEIAPFGKGSIEDFSDSIGGDFLGRIPLCSGQDEITDAAPETVESIADAIEESDQPDLPDDNIGQKGFIRNVIKTVIKGIQRINDDVPIEKIQGEFGVEGRDPLVIEIEITDAGPISGMFSELVMTVDGGELKVMRSKKAKKKGISPEGGMKISSQDLYDAINGEKKVMRSVTGEITTEPYSITDSVKMGDAEIWGDKTINRLSVLDRILNEAVDMSEIQKVMQES